MGSQPPPPTHSCMNTHVHFSRTKYPLEYNYSLEMTFHLTSQQDYGNVSFCESI
ncbi:mCG1051060 [Mus musculus]|nr:mCG1051060 [Mus musculus]